MKKYFYILILLLQALLLKAQDPVCKVINKYQNLPSNTIYDVLKDAQGFIWIAHDKGLSKFDGRRVLNYFNTYKQGKSVTNLMEYNGTIWCQDFAGNFYYAKDDSLINVPEITPSGNYTQAAIIGNKTLVSANIDTVRMYDLLTKKIEKYFINDTAVVGYSPDGMKYILSTYNGINIINDAKISFQNAKVIPRSYLLEIDNVLYGINKNQSPYLFNLQKKNSEKIKLPPNLFIQEVCKTKDEIWFCTSTGAYCFNKNFEPKYDGFCFFKDASISKVIMDDEGSYWFSTLQNGLFYVPNLQFTLLLPQQNISTIASNNGNLLIGTAKGELYQIEKKMMLPAKKIFASNEIEKIYADSNIILIGKDFLFEVSNRAITNVGSYAVKDIVKIQPNLFAVATSNGVQLYSTNINKIKIPQWLPIIKTTNRESKHYYYVGNNFVRTKSVIWNGIDSILYIATVKGLLYYSPNGCGEILLNSNTISATNLYVSSKQIFAGTSDGLFVIEGNKVVKKITKANGLPSNNISKCVIKDSLLWLICNNQLVSYNLSSQIVRLHQQANNLLLADLRDIAIDNNNDIYLASSVGLLHFNINWLSKNTTKPTVILNHFYIKNKLANYHNGIELDEDNNDIEFHFSVNAYRGGDSVKIVYQINNKSWNVIPVGATTLSLNSLGYGFYHIKVKAINENGIESANMLEFDIAVKTPFYKQFWFMALVVLIAMILVAIYFKYQLKKVAERNKLIAEKLKLEEELQSSMMASIKSQMNPHFLFNALNTIQSYIYTNDKINATQYLSKFSKLTRLILEMSNKETVLLSEEISALELYIDLEKTRFEDKLTSILKVENNLDIESIVIPSMLIQPYIENAIKHGLLHKKDNRILTIIFAKENNILIVTIDDNGIGRKRSAILNNQKQKQHESFALNANKKRLEILQKNSAVNIAFKFIDKENQNGESIGTTVVLTLPINTIKQFK